MTVLYLKTRPKKFTDLDSTEAREALIRIFTGGNIPHAFLFTGTKGIGKTSAARIVAKSLNCQNQGKNDYEPCDRCDSCKSINNGSNLDVYEIDAASNRGIDDVRDLREKIKLSPSVAKNKVYIVDEAHMLTPEAFNALLKTLEEPPPHAYFILCTTDFEKLPKTIVSRCQRINFRRATMLETVKRLEKTCREEKIDFDKPGLEAIFKLADGSFRDAVKILEQTSYLGKITVNNVNLTAGLSAEYSPEQLLDFIDQKRVADSLKWIKAANEAGINFKLLIENLVDILRKLMLKSFGITEEGLDKEYFFDLSQIKTLIKLLEYAYGEMRYTAFPSLPLEMAVIEYSGLVDQDRSNHSLKDSGDQINVSSETSVSIEEVLATQGTAAGNGESLVNIESYWAQVLEEVRPLNHSVLAFLRASRPLSLEENGNLTIEVFYKFHKDQLETDKCRRIFEQAAGKVLKVPVKLRCVLGQGKPPVKSPSPPTAPETDLSGENPLPAKVDEDIIRLAEEIFNGGGMIQ